MSVAEIIHPAGTLADMRLSRVLDMAGEGILILDGEGSILACGRACEAMFGWTAREARGRGLALLLPEAGAGPPAPGIREAPARHRDGSRFPVELAVSAVAAPDGRQFVAVVRDLRPRREAEERLGQLQDELAHLSRVAALDQMGSALAHELNQPLTAVMLYLQAAGRAQAKAAEADGPHAGGGDIVRAMLAKAAREAERASRILQGMRHFVERRVPQRAPADINSLVEEAVELSLIGQAGELRLEKILKPGLPEVSVDAVQIQQVIVNLMRNAVEAMDGMKQRRIWIETGTRPGTVVVTVRDAGPGVPAGAEAELFKAFSTSKRSGLGLGLAISRAIARNHGGDITVDPGGNGRGAAFSLVLPAATAPP